MGPGEGQEYGGVFPKGILSEHNKGYSQVVAGLSPFPSYMFLFPQDPCGPLKGFKIKHKSEHSELPNTN